MDIHQYGLYNIVDSYFDDYRSLYLPDNKQEKRPYYCAFYDRDGVLWFIPLSSQIENYKTKIERDEQKRGKGGCLFYHIGLIAGKQSAFLIGNMFPVSARYVKKPFTISGVPYIVKNQKLIREIHARASKYIRLVADGKLKPNVDILSIKSRLLNEQ